MIRDHTKSKSKPTHPINVPSKQAERQNHPFSMSEPNDWKHPNDVSKPDTEITR